MAHTTFRLLALLSSIVLCATALAAADPSTAPGTLPTAPATAPALYTDSSLPFDVRIKDLLLHLNTEQKAILVQSYSPAVKDLSLPALNWWSEANHGMHQVGRATSFPIPMAMAASWDAPLMQKVGDAISDEARAAFDPAGARYRGVILFAPEIDLTKDPRWGRCQECYGEDPTLTSQMAGSFIRGLQGDDPKYLKTAAIIKHFAMYAQEVGRFTQSYPIAERTLREYYFVPFHSAMMDAKTFGVMTAFSGINDVPCVANPWLLKDILRDDWHFPGAIVTDNGAANSLFNNRKYVPNIDQSIAAILNAGVDVLVNGQPTPIWTNSIVTAIATGTIKKETLDEAAAHALMARFRLGLMDPPEKVPFSHVPPTVLASKEHLDLAQQIATESMVLLKNDPAPQGFGYGRLLPIDLRRIKSIAVVGTYARMAQLGSYAAAAPLAPSPFDSISAAVGDRITIRTATGLQDSADIAAGCDVAIVVTGLTSKQEAEGMDRADIELPASELALIQAVVKANPITIVVLQAGSALNISWVKEHCPAILLSWYPGEMGGPALASILLGQTNPAGRLPITFYRSAADLPPITDYEISHGSTYMYLPANKPALYPFGFGLSYTQFTYSHLRLSPINEAQKSLTLTIDITNAGPRDGDEVPQLYLRKTQSTITRPIKQLKGFQRVTIPKGQTKTITFTLPLSELAIWDQPTKSFTIEPGQYEVMIGANSEDIRARQTFQVK